jgi:hypothetical protein
LRFARNAQFLGDLRLGYTFTAAKISFFVEFLARNGHTKPTITNCAELALWPLTLGAGFWVMALDQINQCLPRHNIYHLAQQSFSPGVHFWQWTARHRQIRAAYCP